MLYISSLLYLRQYLHSLVPNSATIPAVGSRCIAFLNLSHTNRLFLLCALWNTFLVCTRMVPVSLDPHMQSFHFVTSSVVLHISPFPYWVHLHVGKNFQCIGLGTATVASFWEKKTFLFNIWHHLSNIVNSQGLTIYWLFRIPIVGLLSKHTSLWGCLSLQVQN